MSERRGWLALGLGASVALHAFGAVWLVRTRPPSVSPGAAGGVETIELQVVSAVAASGRESPPAAPARPRRAAVSPAVTVEVGPAPSEAYAEGEGGDAAPEPVSATATGGGGGDGVVEGKGPPPPTTALLVARLSAAAQRCYPPEAVRFRLAGEAHLAFCLSAEGQASAVKLVRTSGSDALDRAAAECVLPGALPLPDAAGCYELPVRFAARGR